ncbi:hypothetical protein [Streptomyces sp. NPDC046859]|uniref:hypothetical protein n=1 Tax=Streptomyces sp. NPDC046859 TaxID=3155734 RepID=UPI0033CAAFC2
MGDGVLAAVALPAVVFAPLLAEHLQAVLDARARECVRTVEGAGACRYLQRLAVPQACLVQAAAGSDHYGLRRSAEVGRQLLWDATDLLQQQDARSASCELIARERLMLRSPTRSPRSWARCRCCLWLCTGQGAADVHHFAEAVLRAAVFELSRAPAAPVAGAQ